MDIALFVGVALIGFFCGYFVAFRVLKKTSSGFLHIVRTDDEPKPYIFLELIDKSETNWLQNNHYISLRVKESDSQHMQAL